MAPRVGFEPTTLRLTAGCSAVELPRNFGALLFPWRKKVLYGFQFSAQAPFLKIFAKPFMPLVRLFLRHRLLPSRIAREAINLAVSLGYACLAGAFCPRASA